MSEGCKGCARLSKIAFPNNSKRFKTTGKGEKSYKFNNEYQTFCITTEGILHIIDDEWLLKNNCCEKTKEFLIKSVGWK